MGRSKAWMPLYIGDYLADTADLTTEEHGAYLLLLMHYWNTGPLTTDPARLANICKMSRHKFNKYSENILRFFSRKGDKYLHHRLDREISKAVEISEKRAEAGKVGGLAKAKQLPTQPQPQPLIKKNNTSKPANRFDEWWKDYPKKVEKKKARDIWKRRKLDQLAETIIADTKKRQTEDRKWLEGFIVNPTTYLNGDRWEDAIERKTTKPTSSPLEDLTSTPNHKLPEFCRRHGFSTEAPRGADYDGWRLQIANKLRMQA